MSLRVAGQKKLEHLDVEVVQNGRQLLLLVGDKEACNARQVTADVVKGSVALLQQRNNHFHNRKVFFFY